MKLWIRTQDKKALLECEYVRVEELKETHVNNFNSVAVNEVSVGAAIIIEGVMVAKYNSLQRAMQVLDEIQTLLNGKIIVENKMVLKEKQKQSLKEMVNENPIVTNPTVDIKSLNQNCVVYELPQQ